MSGNRPLHTANRAKRDESYTQLSDIENELRHYRNHFRGKTVYCNCDDPRVSEFFHYFSYNFAHLGLEKLVATCYFAMREAACERQAGVCAPCGEHFALDAMEADHIDPWSEGGRTTAENCQMLCRPCNRRKGAR